MVNVSIVIPVYNRQELLKDTIESILLQSYNNYEVLIVDDGSTDKTIQVINSFANKDKRIKLLERDRLPKGTSTCKNLGATFAKGKYLIFWDSDDLMFPWCLDERVRFLDNNPEFGFCFFQLIELFEETGNIALRMDMNKQETVNNFINFKHGGSTQTVFWKIEVFLTLGGWDENICLWEDTELHLRAIFNGVSFSYGTILPDGILRQHTSNDRLTSISFDENKINSILHYFKKVLPHLNSGQINELKSQLRRKILARCFYMSYNPIKSFISNATQIGILSKRELKSLLIYFRLYSVVKYIPYVRRPMYSYIKNKYFSINTLVTFPLTNETKDILFKQTQTLKQEIITKFTNLLPRNHKMNIFKID